MKKFTLHSSIITGLFMLIGSVGYTSEIKLQEGKDYITKFYIKEIIQEIAPTTMIKDKEVQLDTTTESAEQIKEEITAEVVQSRINSLLKTYEGALLYIGWDTGKKCDYDLSVLTKEEKDSAIQSGIIIVSEIALSEEADVICSETLAGYFYEKQDYKKALYWASNGADNGSSVCMALLSHFYMKGIGVVQNYEEGLKWTYLAAAKGDKASQKWIKNYGITSVTDEYLAPIAKEAKLRANQWMLNHQDLFISIE